MSQSAGLTRKRTRELAVRNCAASTQFGMGELLPMGGEFWLRETSPEVQRVLAKLGPQSAPSKHRLIEARQIDARDASIGEFEDRTAGEAARQRRSSIPTL